MVKNDITGRCCSTCGKVKIDIEATGTADTTNIEQCMCADNHSIDKDVPIQITNTKQYLKYKNESTPSNKKRIASRKKRQGKKKRQ